MRNLLTVLFTIGMLYGAQAQYSLGTKAPEGFYKIDTGVFVNQKRAEINAFAFDKYLDPAAAAQQSVNGMKFIEGTYSKTEFFETYMHVGMFETNDPKNKVGMVAAVWTGKRTMVAVVLAASLNDLIDIADEAGWLLGYNWVD